MATATINNQKYNYDIIDVGDCDLFIIDGVCRKVKSFYDKTTKKTTYTRGEFSTTSKKVMLAHLVSED